MSSEVATQLELDAIKHMYERLIAARDQPKNANETIIKDLEGSKMFQDAFCCTDPVYRDQIEIIKGSMPSVVTDDTVGEHLYGCFQPELSIEIACTPACADGGLTNPDLAPCDLASYEKKGELKKLNTIVSDDANVFIAKGNILTKDDINNLRSHGVKVITTYNQDDNTINYVLGESIDITQDQPNPQPQPEPQPTNTANWAWIWVLIAVVVIVLVVALLMRR